jgi:hypothetical protein
MNWQGFSALVLGTAFVIMSASACSSSSSPTPDTADAAPVDPTSRDLSTAAKGEEAVMKRGCQKCHGQDMSGASAKITADLMGNAFPDTVELYPPNLTPDPTGLGPTKTSTDPSVPGFTDDLLARAIRKGIDENDLELCPQMKHFSDMTDFEVYSIVKYLRALPPVNKKILRSVCPPLKTKAQQTMGL